MLFYKGMFLDLVSDIKREIKGLENEADNQQDPLIAEQCRHDAKLLEKVLYRGYRAKINWNEIDTKD